jgi:hypothetical protein
MKIATTSCGVAIALLLASIAAPAVAASDSLQVGTQSPVFLSEAEPNSISEGALISEPGQNVTGTQVILLDEPGTSDISDIVQATILNIPGVGPILFVTLTSDGAIPLSFGGAVAESIPETGAVQNLSAAFTNFFDLNTPLPAINVVSDITEAVPEQSTWAMMLLGFAGVGYAGYRGRRSAVAAAL